MPKVTGEEVKTAMIAAGIENVGHHDCACCGAWVRYRRQGGNLFFDSNCECSSYWSEPEWRPWSDAANWINMQESPKVRNAIRVRFGMPEEEDNG